MISARIGMKMELAAPNGEDPSLQGMATVSTSDCEATMVLRSEPTARGEPARLGYEGNATGRVAWNTLIQAIGKLFGYASGLIIVALTARILSTTGYGDYTIAIVYLSFVYTLSDLGISLIGVREASKSPELLGNLYGSALSLKTAISLIIFAAGAALVFVLPYDPQVKIAVCLLASTTVLTSIGGTFDIAFQSRLQMQTPTLAEMAIKVTTFIGIGVLFLCNRAYQLDADTLFYGVVGVVSASNVVSFLIRWAGARRLVPRGSARFSISSWGRLLRLAIPMGIVTILGQIHYKADTIILSLLQPPDQVAVYGVAYKVLDFMLIFFGVFVSTAFPVLARYSGEPGERFKAAVTRVLNMCLSVALPAWVGVTLLAPEIVDLLGGGHYPDSALPLQILAAAVVFTTINMVYNYVIIVQDRQRALIWVSCVGIIANVSLNLLAIPMYSYLGSAVATDITEGLGMVLAILIVTRMHRVGPAPGVALRIVCASAVMGLAIEGVRHFLVPLAPDAMRALTTLGLIGLGTVSYFTVLFLIGGADEGLVDLLARRVPGLARLRVRPTADQIVKP
jgi:O-antigen/teichoic acid export membrane protein